MQAAQVHPSQQGLYHGHPPQHPSAGYSNGLQQPYKTEQQHSVNGQANGNEMYPYSHPQHQQAPPGYPGMQGAIPPPRMSLPGQQPTLPPMQPGSMQPPPFGYGAPQTLPSTIPSQHQMYGGPPPQQLAMPAKPEPKPLTYSGTKGNHKYTLLVDQQPQRARMCGFGDKDRRPITPPPCIRLVITDINTGKEVDHKDIDGSFFVLQVDLWDQEATREVNIVRASASSPAVSISTATTTSYPPAQERSMYDPYGQSQMAIITGPDGQQYYSQVPQYPGGMYMPQQYAPPQNQSNAMYTRNLIGSLTVNASLLQDTEKKTGYWFVLQDLSVRTEGYFRYVATIRDF